MSRILFVMLHPGYIRYYEDALRAMAGAGHDVHVAFEVTRDKLGEDAAAARLATVSERITCGTTPPRTESVRTFLARSDRTAFRSGSRPAAERMEGAWESLATSARLMRDYLRYFGPAFAPATKLRERAEKRLPRLHAATVRTLARGGAGARLALDTMLQRVEQLIPPSPALEAFLREQRPDLLLVTPLVELGSQQVDYVKSARRMGIRSALCVASWDNLTSKGLIRVLPDRVVVWNEAQKHEAVTLHGVAPEQVVVTGAQLFDRWFDARPERSRDEFCRAVGLDPARPFVLYTGSSSFIAPDEVPFAERWLSHIRSAPGAVGSVGVLFRPHPANARQWRTLDLARESNAAVWPPIGSGPNDVHFYRDYFESLYYSSAVVGINTSAQLEAAIVGRPVLTVHAPEFAHAQEGTLHFRHLVSPDGGFVREARTLEEHVVQLAGAVSTPDASALHDRSFVRAFIRPHGLEVPVAPIFVSAVEGMLAERSPLPGPDPWWVAAARPAGALAARAARSLAEDRPLWVYALRPLVTSIVWVNAAGYRFAGVWTQRARPILKRARRAAHRAWYEGSRRIGARAHRLRKAGRQTARRTAGGARRAIRRERPIAR